MADRSEDPKTAPSYPVALQIADRLVVVVGGGMVAVRRVAGLVAAGARVRVVAPKIATEISAAAARGELIAERRPFEERDLDGALLAFAATDDLAVNGHVVACARSRGILVNDAAQSARGDFTVPLVERNGPITFALDTGAHSPSFT
ncbi:MAG: precorrin-2 dehydrogenase/sirohydrochlorin ferrochelatase family protein, partial [Vulcanimicrobiaceae bacterium]